MSSAEKSNGSMIVILIMIVSFFCSPLFLSCHEENRHKSKIDSVQRGKIDHVEYVAGCLENEKLIETINSCIKHVSESPDESKNLMNKIYEMAKQKTISGKLALTFFKEFAEEGVISSSFFAVKVAMLEKGLEEKAYEVIVALEDSSKVSEKDSEEAFEQIIVAKQNLQLIGVVYSTMNQSNTGFKIKQEPNQKKN